MPLLGDRVPAHTRGGAQAAVSEVRRRPCGRRRVGRRVGRRAPSWAPSWAELGEACGSRLLFERQRFEAEITKAGGEGGEAREHARAPGATATRRAEGVQPRRRPRRGGRCGDGGTAARELPKSIPHEQGLRAMHRRPTPVSGQRERSGVPRVFSSEGVRAALAPEASRGCRCARACRARTATQSATTARA